MNLYFLRHGIASNPGEDGLPKNLPDSERPLSTKGKQRLGDVAWAMRKMELDFDAIISSPWLRARQSAEMVAEALEARRKIIHSEHLAGDGNPRALIEQIKGLHSPQNILLAGHEPYLSRLIALLTTGGTTALIDMRKGGLARLEVEELRYARCATFRWLLTPKQMSLMK